MYWRPIDLVFLVLRLITTIFIAGPELLQSLLILITTILKTVPTLISNIFVEPLMLPSFEKKLTKVNSEDNYCKITLFTLCDIHEMVSFTRQEEFVE